MLREVVGGEGFHKRRDSTQVWLLAASTNMCTLALTGLSWMRDTRVGTVVRHCPSTGETRLTKKGDTYTSVRGTWLAAEFDVGDCVSFLELVNFDRRIWNLLLHSSNATSVANPTALECGWHGSTARVSDLHLAPQVCMYTGSPTHIRVTQRSAGSFY